MDKSDDKPKAASAKSNTRLIVLVAAGAVFVVAAFGVGWVAHNRFAEVRMHGGIAFEKNIDFAPHHMGKAIMMGDGELTNPTDGTAYTRLNGVVTQVSGSTFTIAGNGTTKTITANGDTNYNTTDKVQVNDTVTVLGTDSNNTFTAKNVHVLND